MASVNKLLDKWINGLERTRKTAFQQIKNFITVSDVTVETCDEIEGMLIQADIGFETSQSIIDNLKKTIKSGNITTWVEFQQVMKIEMLKRLPPAPDLDIVQQNPAVIMIVGVNGSGKTTTIAKLANFYKKSGKKVLLAAADTFRAAADEQLRLLAQKIDVPVIDGEPGSDPGAVVFNSIQAVLARKKDIVLIDTAGRLHTRQNLMEELKKIRRVAGKIIEGAPHACWLVIDAVTGQNALTQAQYFKDAVHIDGVILAKLDLSAHGGIVFAILEKLHLPILFVGLGEEIDDLQVFSPQEFIDGIINIQ
jgi:fused signal recognition particle receptor